jgi:ParB family chromosome partitioning protein
MSGNKKALGRGLDALLGNAEADYNRSRKNNENNAEPTTGSIAEIDIALIETNPFQPRTEFEKEALLELAASIKEHGLIQPITVRKLDSNKYQLISGERRFRASQAAELTKIPAYIRVANDQSMLEMALVENIQRKDLNAIEVALSYKRLIDECDLTQEELAKKVSKNRSSVTNTLRLLNLPVEIQSAIIENKISFGHARALLALSDEAMQLYLLDQIISQELSVRQTEEWIKESKQQEKNASAQDVEEKSSDKKTVVLSLQNQNILADLQTSLKKKIDLNVNEKGKGKITIHFKNNAEFEEILALLDK